MVVAMRLVVTVVMDSAYPPVITNFAAFAPCPIPKDEGPDALDG